jgi:hypothetical protein
MPASVARHVSLLCVNTVLEPPEPWFRPVPQLATALVREAQAEIRSDHELAGHELTAIVKCAGCDDVIFSVDDGTFALVHLTWAKHPEPPPWPVTTLLAGFIALEIAVDNHQH